MQTEGDGVMNRFAVFAAALVASLVIGPVLDMNGTGGTGGSARAQDDAVREITKIRGNLYRFRNNGHYSALLVTSAGVIATDPVNSAAATWL